MGYAVPSVSKLFWLCRAAGWRVREIVGGGNDGAVAVIQREVTELDE